MSKLIKKIMVTLLVVIILTSEFSFISNITNVYAESEETELKVATINMPKKVIGNYGSKATITPTITPSNGTDTYQLYKNGVELPEKTAATLVIDKVTVEDEGDYTLVVTSTLGDSNEKVTSDVCNFVTSSFNVELKSEKEEIIPGEIFEVNGYLKNVRNIEDGIVALAGQFEFDSSVMEIYKLAEKDAIVGEDAWNLNAFNEDNFKFVADNGEYIKNDSHVFTIYFKAKDTIKTEQNLTINLKNVSASEGKGVILPVAISEASVHVTIPTEPEEDYITSEKYTINEEKGMITRIIPNTTVADFKNNIDCSPVAIVTDKDGNILSETDIIKTGTIVKVGEEISLTLVVIGDTDGNGLCAVNDLAQIKLHLIEKQALEGVALEAADVDENGNISINDVAQVKLIVIGGLILK